MYVLIITFLCSVRCPLPTDAGPAADSDEETAADSSGGSCTPAEGRAATARTGHCTAKGNVFVYI